MTQMACCGNCGWLKKKEGEYIDRRFSESYFCPIKQKFGATTEIYGDEVCNQWKLGAVRHIRLLSPCELISRDIMDSVFELESQFLMHLATPEMIREFCSRGQEIINQVKNKDKWRIIDTKRENKD